MSKTQRIVQVLGLTILTAGSLNLSAQGRQTGTAADRRLTGTYELVTARSDDPPRAAETSTRAVPQNQRDRAYWNLLTRLEAPQTISIGRSGQTITMASSLGPRSTFDADGRTLRERSPNGQTVETRAEITGNTLEVSTTGGSRDSDYLVTFESIDNGDRLRVTRLLDNEDLQRPVTLQSDYRRTAARPDWNVYANNTRSESGPGRGYGGYGSTDADMVVPDGTRLVAILDSSVSTRPSGDGDPFTMTVRSPANLQGAKISGTMSRVNAVKQNDNDKDNEVRVDFQSIEVRGRSSAFSAVLNTIRLSDGTLLRVNGDRMDPDSDEDQGSNTVRNGTIGAGVGAVIGAIAGGLKGAAIGAAVGGAGGVIVSQTSIQKDLPRGAEMTVTAVSRYRTP